MPGFLAEELTKPHNFSARLAVQTAVDMSLPPTLFMTNRTDALKWSDDDKKLALAYTILQKETCSQCGQPLWICRSSNNKLDFSIQKDTCYVDAELQRASKSKQKSDELKDGEFRFAVPKMIDNSPLPSRDAYLDELKEE